MDNTRPKANHEGVERVDILAWFDYIGVKTLIKPVSAVSSRIQKTIFLTRKIKKKRTIFLKYYGKLFLLIPLLLLHSVSNFFHSVNK